MYKTNTQLYADNVLAVIKEGPILSKYILDLFQFRDFSTHRIMNEFWLKEEPNNIPPLAPDNENLTNDEWIEYLDKILAYNKFQYDNNKTVNVHWLTYNEKRKRSEIKSLTREYVRRKFNSTVKNKNFNEEEHPFDLWYRYNITKYKDSNVTLSIGMDEIIFKLRPDLKTLLEVLMM